jgi:vancomycin resistance protein YoaR
MSATNYPYYRRSRPRPRPSFSFEHAVLAVFTGLMIFAVSLAAFIIGTQIWFAGRIMPGVQVAGIDVGGLATQEAARKISAGVTYLDQGKILLRDGDRIWVAAPAELGLYLDPQASARSAYQVGRESWIGENLYTQFTTWNYGRSILPVTILDQRIAYNYLAALAREVDVPTVEASLKLVGTEVEVYPGQVGRAMDISKTLVLLSVQLQLMRDAVVDLFIDESAPVILDASKQAELARAILRQPVTITMPESEANQAGPWTIDQNTLASMLAFERIETESGMQYQVRLENGKLRSYLANIAPVLTRSPQNARFIFNDDTRQLELIQAAVIGRGLDIDRTIDSIQEKLYGGQHQIPLEITYTNPPIVDQSTGEELGIRELIRAETSYYYGSSAARVQNIKASASEFHGLLIAPGQTFSMASALGDITLDNGYAEALIIVGGQTVKGVGGGVCQVSTTLFRTAFFSGFPIVERHAHAYRVYYYEKVSGNRIDTRLAGLDATVFVPLVDFKFTNDTPYWLLMETYVNPSASTITWKFYSTSDNRRVEWNTTGPTNVIKAPAPLYRENSDLPSGTIKQVDWAADGAEVRVSRSVYRDDTIHIQDTIYTYYQPWQDVYEYGPGTEVPSQ